MQIPSRPPVVVGVDGTAAGLAAVRLAAREAVSRGTLLSVVHAFSWDEAEARGTASRVVEEAVTTAQRSTPGVDVRGQLVDGPAGRVLRKLSRTATLLVLGADDLAATGRLPPTSPLLEAVSQAWCPVVVARAPRPPSGRVIAAVDGSVPSVLALRYAAEDARRRGIPLDVAHVGDEDAGRQVLDRVIAAVPGLPPLRRRVLAGPPAATLIRASRRAGLIVLGPRGAGGAGRFGSVADALLRHGGCPTVFVHGRREPAGKSKPGHLTGQFRPVASGPLLR
ncbi:universal stress protein [Actinoplanes ianthinogenes]|uniref:Universal stress protein n=1 Tax=Actinoplanes ianthinogenes TaxID=122358 RepID=A0ABM7LME8_9ACTN|nr:universal stress protein [Actinoplanes ianthinogenes]BCJ40435.1 universal stress protein [Actinoplanes ianthinogenes]GGR12268.1 universal stress protein [Actinoplanes ianthinogenes]